MYSFAVETGMGMRKKIIAGNWKMNGQRDSIKLLLNEMIALMPDSPNAECVVFPPAVYISMVAEALAETPIRWGAQNMYPGVSGAYTGEVSSAMLKDMRCTHVLVGHSERRTMFGETEKFVAEKFHHAKEHGIIPLLCIGETFEARAKGQTEDILRSQLSAVAEKDENCFKECIIAYEPVWAIGTGEAASPRQVQEAHELIRTLLAGFNKKHAQDIAICYGGSVNEKNAASLLAMPDVDGVLAGGASLNARQFVEIVKCIN